VNRPWRVDPRRATLDPAEQKGGISVKGPIICGVDADTAAGAAHVARALAERHGLALLYAHVVERAEGGAESLERARAAFAADGAEFVLERGHPADRLIALADEREASFLVVGNHGPRSSLLGSISADVARRAPCPVVIVPPTASVTEAGRVFPKLGAEGGIVRLELGKGIRRIA
jgi:nucleotide-binding universal stress UspA family protein